MISAIFQQIKEKMSSITRNQIIVILLAAVVMYKLCLLCCNKDEVESFKGDDKKIFRMFHVKWCGHCKTAKPKFIEFMKNNPKINAELIDAEDATKKDIVTAFEKDIEGYPTFILTKGDTSEVYDGERTVEGFEKFINNNY